MKFYICNICGKVIEIINDTKVPTICCGEAMSLLEANTSEGAIEKHIPVYEIKDKEIIIKVGANEHPMEEDHYIMWVAQVKGDTVTRVELFPGQVPEVKMEYKEGATIYAYCNKHSLWKKEV